MSKKAVFWSKKAELINLMPKILHLGIIREIIMIVHFDTQHF